MKGKALGVSFMDKFASKQTSQQVIGSATHRDLTTRQITGDKNTSINDGSIQNIISSMTEREQGEVLCEFKHLAMNHPEQIRDLLIESPQFAHTILSLMTMYQLIDTTAVDQFMSSGGGGGGNVGGYGNNQQQQQQQYPNAQSPGSTLPINIDLTKLSQPERDFYDKWQNYNEQQRSTLRAALTAPGASQDQKLLKVIQVWNSLQLNLGMRL